MDGSTVAAWGHMAQNGAGGHSRIAERTGIKYLDFSGELCMPSIVDGDRIAALLALAFTISLSTVVAMRIFRMPRTRLASYRKCEDKQ